MENSFIKNSIMLIGILVILVSLVRIVSFAGYGYSENIEDIGMYVFICVIGYAFFLLGYNLDRRKVSEQEMQDAIRAKAREDLKRKMHHWDKELEAEELEELASAK